jgi:hypothetical protein
MGVISEIAGLGTAMAGAGLIGIVGAAAVVIGAGMADRARRHPAAA